MYDEAGHTQTWSINKDGAASGNPLVGNRDIELLRRAHRIHLAKYGSLTRRARPLSVYVVCAHAVRFWNSSSVQDMFLHAVFLLGLNLGLRYNEVTKLRVELSTVLSTIIMHTLRENINNSTVQRDYTIEE